MKQEIQEILKDADLDDTSAKMVRLQLQQKLGCHLIYRRKEVDELVMEVIDEHTQNDNNEELKMEIHKILKDADLENTSAKMVRLLLGEKLECDLTNRKKEIDTLIMEFIDNHAENDDEESDTEEEPPIKWRRHIDNLLFG